MRKYIVLTLLLALLCTGAASAATLTFSTPAWVSSSTRIPASLMVIEDEAFSGDTSLTQVTIPASVMRVGANAFAGCENVERIAIFSRDVVLDRNSLGTVSELKEIWAPGNSTAEAYAKAYGYTFCRIPLDAADLLEYADSKLGTKYIRGTWDCILYVRNCYLTVFGIKVPDSCNRMQYLSSNSDFLKQGYTPIKITNINDLMPGDIICWKDDTHDYCTHVGMYVGESTVNGVKYSDGTFIENSNSKGNVRYNNFEKNKLSSTYTPYYIRNFMYAWRIL